MTAHKELKGYFAKAKAECNIVLRACNISLRRFPDGACGHHAIELRALLPSGTQGSAR